MPIPLHSGAAPDRPAGRQIIARRLRIPLLFLLGGKLLSGWADDRFYPVTDHVQLSSLGLGAPSVNAGGDVVVKVTKSSSSEIRVFLFKDQNLTKEGSIVPSLLVRSSTGTLGGFPVINDQKSVATYNSLSGIQVIQRFNYNGTSFSGQTIARGQVTQTAPNPYAFLSSLVGLDNRDGVYFYGERTPLGAPYLRAIYRAETEVTAPATISPLAATPAFDALDPYVTASGQYGGTAPLVGLKGTLGGAYGVYRSAPVSAAATAAVGNFASSGGRPALNSNGTVAVQGTISESSVGSQEGVFLVSSLGVAYRAGNQSGGAALASRLAAVGEQPALYLATGRVALNDFGQVAYVATDADGADAIYTTNLGRSRRMIGEGDHFHVKTTEETVAAVALWDGLKQNGQLIFWVSTGGATPKHYLLRANRAFNQVKLLDTPIEPTYQDSQYLLRGIASPPYGLPNPPVNSGKIRAVGCNLTSTANILSAYGYDFSPGQMNAWLVQRWSGNLPGHPAGNYVTRGNDFPDEVVRELSSELRWTKPELWPIQFVRVHNPAAAGASGNLDKIVSELRQGFPVKLRVPNGKYGTKPYRALGHYVIAYGLADPTKTAAITRSDILIHDPGDGGIYTLGDYGSKLPAASATKYDDHDPAWLESGQRVYIYRPFDPVVPLPARLFLTITSSALAARSAVGATEGEPPVYVVVRDSLGRRIGSWPVLGTLEEAPGYYLHDTTYYGLDGEEGSDEPVWGNADVQRIAIDAPASGDFVIELIGGAGGSYQIELGHEDEMSFSADGFEGAISAGQTTSHSFTIGTSGGKLSGVLEIEAPAPGTVRLHLASLTGVRYQLQESTDLLAWTDVAAEQAGNGGQLEWVLSTGPEPRHFFRAILSRP